MSATASAIASSHPPLENSYPAPKRGPRVAFVDLYPDSRVDVERDTYGQDNDEWEESSENSELLGSNRIISDDQYRTRWRVKDLFIPLVTGLIMAAIIFGAIYVEGGGRRSHPFPGPSAPTDIPPDAPRNKAFLVKAKNGVVASENEDCSLIGVQILKEGGNAVDAAIASNLCIGTVNMFSSGIGGGGFAIVRVPPTNPKSSNASMTYTVDFRETGPALANATMYPPHSNTSQFGGLSVGIPGELRGLAEMHRRWGRLEWRKIVEPSVFLAMGWSVGPELDKKLRWFGRWIPQDPDWQPIFAPMGSLLSQGQWISRPAYGQTLATIAEQGAEAFYKGPIAEAMVKKVQEMGGVLTLGDLASYQPIVQPALEGSYRGRKVYTTHPPTSGVVVLHILNILESFDLIGEGRTPTNVHRLVEALKFGFGARTNVADPAFLEDTTYIRELSTKKFGDIIAANVTDDRTHPPEYYHPVYDVHEDSGTTHTSVVDSDGFAVGITSTINLPFGSRVLDPKTGIIMNDEMDDFSTPHTPNAFGLWPSPYNYPAAGKRPLSSIAPVIMEKEDGRFHLIVGGSGGSRIFGAVVQAILGTDWGMDISSAIEQPRVHHQLFPQELVLETTISNLEVESLKAIGHHVAMSPINLGRSEVQGVYADDDGTFFGASDSRKNGVAAGY